MGNVSILKSKDPVTNDESFNLFLDFIKSFNVGDTITLVSAFVETKLEPQVMGQYLKKINTVLHPLKLRKINQNAYKLVRVSANDKKKISKKKNNSQDLSLLISLTESVLDESIAMCTSVLQNYRQMKSKLSNIKEELKRR